ncbi:hypothetical protein [Marinobacter arenosus]|uniref:hypothetical protein n=1 Tax=Marinobacter arenosus TaxID=2856822 RepID=UPI001C4D6FAD|nr:hypothetical protein [Marinobacter arenosus]MBW0145880.1 hypothetical protein [Marinobacter arenosus]
MENWKQAAIKFFPDIEADLLAVESPSELWIEIEFWFFKAVERGDSEFQQRVIGFLNYCTSGVLGDKSSQIQQAVYCGILENIGRNKRCWPYLGEWFDRASFDQYRGSLIYSLTDWQAQELTDAYESGRT